MTAAERATLEQLRQENQELRAQVVTSEQTIRDLRDQNRQLQDKLDEQ
jgi:cell division protein FtsB